MPFSCVHKRIVDEKSVMIPTNTEKNQRQQPLTSKKRCSSEESVQNRQGRHSLEKSQDSLVVKPFGSK